MSLSSDGQTVAVGNPGSDNRNPVINNAGFFRVFNYDGSSNVWTTLGEDIKGKRPFDHFGMSLSVSADGGILAVGASEVSNSDRVDQGYSSVFQYAPNVIERVQLGQDIGSFVGSFAGYLVSLSADGRFLAIGASFHDGNGVDSGRLRVYRNPVVALIQ